MPPDYTHKFKFELANGWLEGDVEFNTDGKASFKVGNWNQPLPQGVLEYFNEIIDLCVKITHDVGTPDTHGIKHISFKLKE